MCAFCVYPGHVGLSPEEAAQKHQFWSSSPSPHHPSLLTAKEFKLPKVGKSPSHQLPTPTPAMNSTLLAGDTALSPRELMASPAWHKDLYFQV